MTRTPLNDLPHVDDVLRWLARAASNACDHDAPVRIRLDDGHDLEGDMIEVYKGPDRLRVTIDVACKIPLPKRIGR